jgi:hypothetical protein
LSNAVSFRNETRCEDGLLPENLESEPLSRRSLATAPASL